MPEFELIERIRARIAARDDVVLGIGDDAAVLQLPAGRQLVVATDTLNCGVHFPESTAPADIGWKALAVNLSDLAAMGAAPAWCTLSLSMPAADATWLDGFLDGFLALAALHDVGLVGGDTTRGPLSVCVTVHGLAEPGRFLRRDGARAWDDVWVSGTLGDAAGGLAQLMGADAGRRASTLASALLQQRLDRPTPRIAAGLALVGVAHGAIDVSDGLLADLGHICRASGVAARLELDCLPASDALREAFAPARVRDLQTGGGDDYELCFTAPASSRGAVAGIALATGTTLTRIGRIEDGDGVSIVDADGRPWLPGRAGYAHFDG